MRSLLSLVLLFAFVGCSSKGTNPNGVPIISQSEYEKRAEAFTQRTEKYSGLMNTMHMSATLINSQTAEAQLLQKSRLYQWDQATFDKEKEKAATDLNKVTQVFVSLYTPERKHDDLHKSQTLWKIFLDANGRRWEGKAVKIKLLTNEVQALYPDHTRFATPYMVTFPVPVTSIESHPIKLTLTGSVTSATVQFQGARSCLRTQCSLIRFYSLNDLYSDFAFKERMPRALTILQSEFPYNISARCINREWFNIPMDEVWDIFCEELTNTATTLKLDIHSFVLMSNHFHLIASTPEANISTCMQRFMHKSSLRLTRKGNRINQTFSGRHYKCILQHPNYFLNAYKYNYRNPVVAGICEKVESYPFSTLQFVMGTAKSKIPLIEDIKFQSDPTATLSWLNSSPDPEKLEALRFGFKHQYFKSKKDRNSGQYIILENEVL